MSEIGTPEFYVDLIETQIRNNIPISGNEFIFLKIYRETVALRAVAEAAETYLAAQNWATGKDLYDALKSWQEINHD